MPKLRHLLDDVQIRNWIATGEPVAKSDGDGLTFTLSKAGTATWVLRYRIGAGRRRELTIGNYPDVKLAEARKAARSYRAAIDRGEDPALAKQVEKIRNQGEWTVKRLADDYKAKRLLPSELSAGTIYYRRADIDQIIVPKLGVLPVGDVRPGDIVHMIESCGRSWVICRRALTATLQLFAHACGKRMIDTNPAMGINLRALMGPRPAVRKRVMLSEEDLRKLLVGVDDCIGRENALAFRILLATCVRSVELEKARWEHIDFERRTWLVPAESVKTRAGFLVPLAAPVLEWFRALQALAEDSAWVLPARSARRTRRLGDTHVSENTLWAAIDRAFKRSDIAIQKFTPHDTRSTAKGHMRNMGVSREISEIALNHVLKGMEAIYDVREEIPERRDALEKWAAFLVACEIGQPAPTNVLPIRKQQIA